MQRESTISLSHIPMVLYGQENHENYPASSRRVSSASTASSLPSLPRTPSSARDSHDYYWRESKSSDVDRLASLREAFDQTEYSPSDSNTPLTPNSLQIHTDTVDVERSGWNLSYKSPVRSLSVISPAGTERTHRVSRSASTVGPGGSVRPWPQRPAPTPVAEREIEEEISRLSMYEEVEEDDDYQGKTDDERSQRSGSDADTGIDASLRRRRHIRRPARAKQQTPRRLPPLPGTLVHSHSTAARFTSTAPTASFIAAADVPSNMMGVLLDDGLEGMGDLRRRSHTISGLPSSRIRPLPLPTPANQNVQSPPPGPVASPPPPPPTQIRTVPKAKVPRLRLAPVDPSEAAEADAVLTKTPNRRFNPLGSAGFSAAPPMPQDASSRLDWDLIEDLLEADFVDDTPTPIARGRSE